MTWNVLNRVSIFSECNVSPPVAVPVRHGMRHPRDDSDTATYTATLRRSAPLDGVLPQTVGVRRKPMHTGHVRQLGLSLCGGRWRHGHPGRARASRRRPGLATTASVSNDHVITVQRFLSGLHGARTLKKMSRLSIRQ